MLNAGARARVDGMKHRPAKVQRFSQRASFFLACLAFVLLIVLMCLVTVSFVLFVFGSGSGTIHIVGGEVVRQPGDESSRVGTGILMFFVLLSSILVPAAAASFIYTRLRWKYVASDHPLCPECGYNLTGNESGDCPECGTRVPKQDCGPEVRLRNKA